MNSDILLKIREEVSRRLETLDKDNEYARRREEVENEEEVKEVFEEIDDVDDFYPFGERIQLNDIGLLSMEAQNFIVDVNWVKDGMGLAFFVNSKTIEMYLCSNDGFDCFRPELKFVFKRTFDWLFD